MFEQLLSGRWPTCETEASALIKRLAIRFEGATPVPKGLGLEALILPLSLLSDFKLKARIQKFASQCLAQIRMGA